MVWLSLDVGALAGTVSALTKRGDTKGTVKAGILKITSGAGEITQLLRALLEPHPEVHVYPELIAIFLPQSPKHTPPKPIFLKFP